MPKGQIFPFLWAPPSLTLMARGRGKLAIGQGVSVWVLEAPDGFGDAQIHSHHAIQLTICLGGELTLAGDSRVISAPVIGVAADARHRLEARGLIIVIFVEPESRTGRKLAQLLFSADHLVELDPQLLSGASHLAATFEDDLSLDDLLRNGRELVDRLVQTETTPEPDPRIERIINYAIHHIEEPLTLASASAGVFLSPSRLRHLFVEQTGVAFKTYILWLRLVRAVQVYSEGKVSLTEAAHSAGFADSAHFSRAFKRTFGSPATTLTRL